MRGGRHAPGFRFGRANDRGLVTSERVNGRMVIRASSSGLALLEQRGLGQRSHSRRPGRRSSIRKGTMSAFGTLRAPATSYLTHLQGLPIFQIGSSFSFTAVKLTEFTAFSIFPPASCAASAFSSHSACVYTSRVNEPAEAWPNRP